MPIVAATGRHLAKYHPAGDPLLGLGREALADLFEREIERGVEGSGLRCGVIKVAGGERGPGVGLTDDEREAFHAAAETQRRTGCPILTHTEGGADAMTQVVLLRDDGADLSRVTLSHCDKNPDPAYHRDLLGAGVYLEYDQHHRQLARATTSASLDLLAGLLPIYPDRFVVGMDLARRSYWPAFGGGPGPAWLVTDIPPLLMERGLDAVAIDRLYLHNPAACFSFLPVNAAA